MKSSIVFILLWFLSSITIVQAQEREVEGFVTNNKESINRIKLVENERNELVLFVTDSVMNVDFDSLFLVNRYRDFTIGESVNKVSDTIQKVVILENGELKTHDVEMGLKLKKSDEGFSLKIAGNKDLSGPEEFVNGRTLNVAERWWCPGTAVFSNSKAECEKSCSGDCFIRSF